MEGNTSNSNDPSGSLQTVKFLRKHGLQKLTSHFSINARRHQTHSNLIQLKYDQIKSPMEEPIVQECRGLIVDEKDNWRVISYPYLKFFNYGEPNATEIDWNSAIVYEKIDGSLATLYNYKKKWWVASSSLPDASGPLGNGFTFAELFWDVWKQLNYNLPEEEHLVFMFELLTHRNIIIVRPSREAIMLHGVRDMRNLKEMDPKFFAEKYKYEMVPTFDLHSLDEIVKSARKMNPVQNEGYVVRDKHFNRLKVKSPAYVGLSHLTAKDKNGLNSRGILRIVMANEGDEFLAYFPMYRDLYRQIRAAYGQLAERIQKYYDEAKTLTQIQFDAYLDFIKQPSDKNLVRRMREKNIPEVRDLFNSMEVKDVIKFVEAENIKLVPTLNQHEKEELIKEKDFLKSVEGIATKKGKKKAPKSSDKQTFVIDDTSMVPKKPQKKNKTQTKTQKDDDEDWDEIIEQFKQKDQQQSEKKVSKNRKK